MPKAFPEEFRRDVIAVARKGEAPLRQIAKDFGVSENCLHGWLKIANRIDGIDTSPKRATQANPWNYEEPENALNCSNKKPRSRAVPSPTSPRTSTQNDLPPQAGGTPPLVLDLAADGVPVTVTCRVLRFSTQAVYKWKKRPVTQQDWDGVCLVRDIHADGPAVGYRFIADELGTAASRHARTESHDCAPRNGSGPCSLRSAA